MDQKEEACVCGCGCFCGGAGYEACAQAERRRIVSPRPRTAGEEEKLVPSLPSRRETCTTWTTIRSGHS